MYYIGLDVHKKTISYCVKDAAGKIHQEGKIGSTRRDLDSWISTHLWLLCYKRRRSPRWAPLVTPWKKGPGGRSC
jgi:hypothetical protein